MMAMDIGEKYKAEIKSIVRACRRLGELGYVTSSGGNLSVRVEENLMLITPTKTLKRTMKLNDICAVQLNGEIAFEPKWKKPTGEMPFHIRIMRSRPDVKAIVHAHPPILTGFAIAHSDLLSKPFLPEPAIEVGPILNVEYAAPLSEELSENFDKVIKHSNGFLMENHGALICSSVNVEEAVEQLQMMEEMARSVLVAKCLGKAEMIPDDELTKLDSVLETRGLKIPGYGYGGLRELYKQE